MSLRKASEDTGTYSTCPDQKLITELGLKFDAATFDWGTVKCQGILNKCFQSKATNPTCGRILTHASEQVSCILNEVGASLCIFKIGVSANPLLRFASYLNLGYTTMWVIHVSSSLGLTHMLEASLIREYQSFRGCRNKDGSGGEGALNTSKCFKPPFFTYVVGARADQPRCVG